MTDPTHPADSSASAEPQGGELQAACEPVWNEGQGSAHTPEYQAWLDRTFAKDPPDIPVSAIDLTGLGDCRIAIGANGEITSIAKGNGPQVPVLPIQSPVEN